MNEPTGIADAARASSGPTASQRTGRAGASALASSELAVSRRRRSRRIAAIPAAVALGVTAVAVWGERGDPSLALAPIRTTVALGAPHSVAGTLLPLVAVVASLGAALRGAQVRASADETFVLLPGPVRGSATAAAVRGVGVATWNVMAVLVAVVSVLGGRVAGDIDGGIGRDALPTFAAWVGLGGRSLVLAAVVAAAWAWGLSIHRAPAAALIGWSVLLVGAPAAVAAVLDHPTGEVGGALVEHLLRGGPLVCTLSGAWPAWVDPGSHAVTAAVAALVSVFAAATFAAARTR